MASSSRSGGKRGPERTIVRAPEMVAFFKTAGGVYEVANHLGISAPAVSQWDFVPSKHVNKLAEWLGLPETTIPQRPKKPGKKPKPH